MVAEEIRAGQSSQSTLFQFLHTIQTRSTGMAAVASTNDDVSVRSIDRSAKITKNKLFVDLLITSSDLQQGQIASQRHTKCCVYCNFN